MRLLSKDVKKKKKKDVKNKAIKASYQRSNCPHGSLIIHQMFQRAMCRNNNGNHCHFRDETSSEKAWIFAGFAKILALELLFLRNSTCIYQKTWFRNTVQQRVSADLSRLEIKDSDMANQVEIVAHLFCLFSPRGQNNRWALQRQVHFNVINHWGPTPTL